MDELIATCRSAQNHTVTAYGLRDIWGEDVDEISCDLQVLDEADKLARVQHEEWKRNRKKPTPELIERALAILDRSSGNPFEPSDELPKGYRRKR